MPQLRLSTLCFSRKQSETLVFDMVTGERIVIEFKECKHLRTNVVLTMHPSVVVTKGELLSGSQIESGK